MNQAPSSYQSSGYQSAQGSPMGGTPSMAYKASNAASQVTGGAVGYLDQAAANIKDASTKNKSGGVWNLIILFVVIALVIMFISWAFRLPVVLESGPGGVVTNTVSFGKVLATGLIGSAFIILIIWLFSKLFGGKY